MNANDKVSVHPPTQGGGATDVPEQENRKHARLRILMVLNSPNWSGASSYCIELSRLLVARGHQVLLLTEPGKPCDRAREAGLPCDDTIRLNHRNPLLYVHAITRMATMMRAFRPDVVSAHINEGAWMAGMLARRVIPHAAVIRTRSDIDPPKGHFVNRHVHHHWTDHLIVSSALHRGLCQDLLGLAPDTIDVVYGAIDTARFHPDPAARSDARRELGVDPATPLIGVVGRLDPVKGHEHVLAALRQLADAGVSCKMAIVGHEVNRSYAWLHHVAQELGVTDRLITLGRREDVPRLLNGCDVGLVASVGSEAICRAALEFMATGVPVVATRVGVIPEIIDDAVSGLLVPPAAPEPMAVALRRFLTDAGLRQDCAANGLRVTRARYAYPTFVATTEEIYRRVVVRKTANVNNRRCR